MGHGISEPVDLLRALSPRHQSDRQLRTQLQSERTTRPRAERFTAAMRTDLSGMTWHRTFVERMTSVDLLGVRFAVNIFVATTLLWLMIRTSESLNPIWAVSSMI